MSEVFKYLFLTVEVLLNGFAIAYSCLLMETTMKWNWFITYLFSGVINTITEKEVEVIPVTEIDIFLSKEESYIYNYIPEYKVDEISLGSAKQIECSILPDNASDKSIQN